jgi:hypothetical protein
VPLPHLAHAIAPGAPQPRDANLTEILRIAQTALYHSRAEHLPEE